MMLIFAGNLKTESVYAYSYTTVYLEAGESYTQAVSSSKPVFDAYGESDKAVCSADWNSTDKAKRTKFTIKAKASGSATFYVCKGGKSATENRVRTVKVYVYNKASATTLNITNSTSKTGGIYVNMPIYLYTSKTSTCTLTQTNSFPMNVSADTSGKAKAQSTTYTSSNTNIAPVNSSGMVTGVSQGYATVTAKRSWTTSAGNVKTISKTISVYCKNLPQLSVYNGTTAISNLIITTIDKPALTYKLSNMQSTDTIASASCTSADTSKFTVASGNGVYKITPVNVTNGITVNAIFKIVLNSEIRTHNGDEAATFIKSVPVIINKDANVYVTNVSFKDEDVEVINGSAYKQIADVAPANATNQKVTYKSSDTKVATVDSLGNVNAVGCGTATITATSEQVIGCAGSYTIKVIEKPTVISAIENTATGLKLEWEEVLNATYQIYRCTEANGSYVKIKTATGTTYTDEDSEYGTKYYYKIKVIPNIGGTYASDFSNIIYEMKKLENPVIKSISDGKQVKINWIKVDGAVRYEVYRRKNKGSLKKIGISTAYTYTDTAVSYENTYTYVIRAVADNGYCTDYSKALSIKHTIKAARVKKAKKIKDGFKLAITRDKYTGYAVYVGKNKKPKKLKALVKGKTVSIRYKMKKKKKYYIRIRPYVKEGKKIIYGSYSKAVRIK